MTAGRAAAETPHPLAITMMAAVAGLVPLIVFGNRIVLLVFASAALPAILWAVIRHPRAGWLLAVACLPITTTVPIATTGARVSIPLEVLAGALAPLLLFALLRDPPPIRRFLLHPLSIAVGLQLAWMVAATVFSSDPVVSTKALAVRTVYLTVFYYGGFIILSRASPRQLSDPVQITTVAVLFFAIPTTLWSLARHAPYGFARRNSYEVAQPFFSNHTEYATVLVVWACLAVGLRWNTSDRYRKPLALLLALIGAALFVAGARSAWIALLAALMTLAALRFRPDLRKTAVVAALFVLLIGTTIVGLSNLRSVETSHSEEPAGRSQLFDSPIVENLVGGESSSERLNRWSSAVRMFRDRPLFGFGPATYEAAYGGYQQHQELTRVSTFKGDRGGAHSDFMTAIAEHGFGGLLSLAAVMILGLRSGLNSVRHAATSRDHLWAVSWTAAFIAVIVSSCFNSLLELDKTAPLFWLAAAVLVHLDLKSTGLPECAPEDRKGLLGRPRPTEIL